MSYEPKHQFRCTIIRGKAQSKIEDFLPLYANTVHKICPCTKKEFYVRAYKEISSALFSTSDYEHLPEANKKTVRNHASEISGALLDLYYFSDDGIVRESESCSMLLSKMDFPLFFKNLCINFQFPNGAKRFPYAQEPIDKKVHIKPYCYVVSLLYYAQSQPESFLLTKQEIAYYVLNNLDVLKGDITCKEVYEAIKYDRDNKIIRPRLKGSYYYQHIKEQYNLLELSNIIVTNRNYIWLNKDEGETIKLFMEEANDFIFDAYKYDTSTRKGRNVFTSEWRRVYGKINKKLMDAATRPTFSIKSKDKLVAKRGAVGLTTIELGDEGETLVYNMEKERVAKYKARLTNKVILFGKTKGLGYDIHSIEADENAEHPEFDRYIEVKSTTRVTEPSFDDIWIDSLNITAKEWVAAQQYKEYYNIYRVYFTKKSVIVIRINNPYQLFVEGKIEVYATNYTMNFGSDVIEIRSNGKRKI